MERSKSKTNTQKCGQRFTTSGKIEDKYTEMWTAFHNIRQNRRQIHRNVDSVSQHQAKSKTDIQKCGQRFTTSGKIEDRYTEMWTAFHNIRQNRRQIHRNVDSVSQHQAKSKTNTEKCGQRFTTSGKIEDRYTEMWTAFHNIRQESSDEVPQYKCTDLETGKTTFRLTTLQA
jgi:transcriptional regulator NrdR family protein